MLYHIRRIGRVRQVGRRECTGVYLGEIHHPGCPVLDKGVLYLAGGQRVERGEFFYRH